MLYAITDRRHYGANEATARTRLLEQAAAWAAHEVAFIQLREKDLPAREQVKLAREMMQILRAAGRDWPRLLVNGRADVALAAGADGVHLPAGPDALTPEEVRRIFLAAGRAQPPILSVSCHTLVEIEAVRLQSPDCILFAPVFEKVVGEQEIAATKQNSTSKQILPGTGLALLEQACRVAAPVPVFALGGVTAENAKDCLHAGAVGIAAIRLLHEPASAWRHLSPPTSPHIERG